MRKPRACLVIMAKEPLPGRVKTRLAREVGSTVATWWFRHQLKKTIRTLNDPRWDIIVSLSPDIFVKRRNFWSPEINCIPQGRGNLGQKMRNILKLFANRPICIIGGDIPGITRPEISEAFKKTKDLFDDLGQNKKVEMKTLSMGMSGDFELAIEKGSNSIRIGTAVFGPRG